MRCCDCKYRKDCPSVQNDLVSFGNCTLIPVYDKLRKEAKEQAVREFADRLKKLCDEKMKLFEMIFDKATPNQASLANNFLDRRFEWGIMRKEIDKLLAEVTGE